MSVLGRIGTRATRQRERARADQVANSEGGAVFALDDWSRLQRFLVLGVDAGTFYVNPRDLALDSAACVDRCLAADGKRAVDTAAEVSLAGLAPSNDPAIFVLARAAAHADPDVRRHALSRLADVCRIGTHLFHFARFVEAHRGWGRALRRAVAAWYTSKDADQLAYQIVKYRQRDGWSHRDLLRLAHPEARDMTAAQRAVIDFATHGDGIAGDDGVPRIIEGFAKAQDADAEEAAELVREYGLPWEVLNPDHLAKAAVWSALLESSALPLGALVRNLGVLTARGVVARGSAGTRIVRERLANVDAIKRARLHPIAVLNAIVTYAKGKSRGGVTWDPVPGVVDALDGAFYAAFQAVEPAGKRTVLAIDVSGSMSWRAVTGGVFNAAQGAAAMAMVTAATEPETIPVAFSQSIVGVDVSPRRRLDDQMRVLSGVAMGGTDCAQPMLWATTNRVEADTFIVLTDSETWAGAIHPFQALRQYRERMGIPARMIVVGMTSTGFTIADPDDPGMLDVVGMDASTPAVMNSFSRGDF